MKLLSKEILFILVIIFFSCNSKESKTAASEVVKSVSGITKKDVTSKTLPNGIYADAKVAILDFENTSGITKYDGFGKALSNMLITDLKNNIHPRKIAFLERSQLNKILEEQGLQKSKDFDNETAVNFGKLAGVNFVIVGNVYVMEGQCNINARLVDVETSEIIYSKESNGEISKWMELKTALAEELSESLSQPIKLASQYSNEVNEGTLDQYSKVIEKMDNGNIEEASKMTEMLSSVLTDFKYFEELKIDIEELKRQVEENTENIDKLKKSGGRVLDAETFDELKLNLQNQLTSKEECYQIIHIMGDKYASQAMSEINQLYALPWIHPINIEVLNNQLKKSISILSSENVTDFEKYYWAKRIDIYVMTMSDMSLSKSNITDLLNNVNLFLDEIKLSKLIKDYLYTSINYFLFIRINDEDFANELSKEIRADIRESISESFISHVKKLSFEYKSIKPAYDELVNLRNEIDYNERNVKISLKFGDILETLKNNEFKVLRGVTFQ